MRIAWKDELIKGVGTQLDLMDNSYVLVKDEIKAKLAF